MRHTPAPAPEWSALVTSLLRLCICIMEVRLVELDCMTLGILLGPVNKGKEK